MNISPARGAPHLPRCSCASLWRNRLLRADQLKSPWDAHPVALTATPYNCPDPPPFSKSLDAEGYYIDAHHSVIDPVKKAAYEKAAAAPDHLGQWSTQAADAYLQKGSRAGAQCVYTC